MPWVGDENTMDSLFDIPWIGVLIDYGLGVKIPWEGGSKYHDIPWIGGLIYNGLGVK